MIDGVPEKPKEDDDYDLTGEEGMQVSSKWLESKKGTWVLYEAHMARTHYNETIATDKMQLQAFKNGTKHRLSDTLNQLNDDADLLDRAEDVCRPNQYTQECGLSFFGCI